MPAHRNRADSTPCKTLLVQLPIPQLNFARQTGNIPLGGACLKMAADAAGIDDVSVLPQSLCSYVGDAALLAAIRSMDPDVIGFSVYAWNIDRSLYLARRLKTMCRARIIFGGPEITPDNHRVRSSDVDFYVVGEGEATFVALLQNPDAWAARWGQTPADEYFQRGDNPYRRGLLEPAIENLALIETQRGCPHRCGYCYYGKARQHLTSVPVDRIVDAVAWARDRGIGEIYLLDPCLNARRDIHDLLSAVAGVNADRALRLISEIRAESVSAEMADGFAKAGFGWFEIGLQSTNARALRIMNRPTDTEAFLRGAGRLRKRGIDMGIDLIAGLPGDDPAGFSRSVDFVDHNGLAGDIQVFPLSVLPGTPFRQRHRALGLEFDPDPPYTVLRTPGFSRQAIASALDQAQERFDLSLYPFPDLELSGCGHRFMETAGNAAMQIHIGNCRVIAKLLLNDPAHLAELDTWARHLGHPYQVVFGPRMGDERDHIRVVQRLTAENPHTPLEIVFLEPRKIPDTDRLIDASHLRRPHYLDKDLAFLYPQPGNRAMLFTLVSENRDICFQGEMQRQVLWWAGGSPPDAYQMDDLEPFDGLLISETVPSRAIEAWQSKWHRHHQDLTAITFADPHAQRRWIQLTAADEYWPALLPDRQQYRPING